MRKNQCITLWMLLVVVGFLSAQIPQPVVLGKKASSSDREILMTCENQFSGTKSYGLGVGQSRDITAANLATDPRVIVLCWGDSVQIRHGGDQNLSGDPRPTSDPGVGYAIYTQQPTVTGPTLADIIADNTLKDFTNDLFVINQGRLDGNVDFFNRGFFQNNLHGGAPIQLWFAPITFDSLAPSGKAGYEPDMSGVVGPCVHVNVDEAFSVIYLNRIVIQQNQSSRCKTSMTITGGMPEFTALEKYRVDIFSDPPGSIGRTCENFKRPGHNESVLYQFEENGRYRVIVSDTWGCDASDIFLDIDCYPTEVVFGQDMTVDTNEVFCIDITVNDFENINGFSFQMLFDTNLLDFVEFRNAIWQVPERLLRVEQPNNFVSAILFDLSLEPRTLNDGDRLFTACFRSKDETGCADFVLNPDIAAVNEFNDTFCIFPSIFTPSQVCIETVMQGEIDIATCSTEPGTSNGSIIISPRVGTAPYSFEIFDINDLTNPVGSGNIANLTDTIEFVGLAPGSYEVHLTDASGNTEIVQVTIAAAPHISIGGLAIMHPSCFDQTDGSVTLQSINDGVSPYTIQWSTGQTNTNTIASLPNGEYSVTVYDRNGCPAKAKTTLFTDTLKVEMHAEELTSCPGATDGRVYAQAFGGVGPYDFYWNGGAPDLDVLTSVTTNAPSGLQTLRVVDANGCELVIDTFFLGSYNLLNVDSSLQDITCFGQDDGAISITPLNGSGPYVYDWGDIGVGPAMRSGLTAGIYTLRVTDAGGCFDTLSFTLSEPDSLSLFVDSLHSTQILCNGESNGRIVLLATGGDFVDGFTMNWAPDVSNGFSAINLVPGFYQATVIDSRGCQDQTSFEIVEAPDILFNIPPIVEPNCPGDTTFITVDMISGGSGGPYLFNVDAGTDHPEGTLVPIFAGRHLIEVMDTLGCAKDTLIDVLDPEPITIFLPEEIIVNLGDSSQRLVPDIRPLASRDDVVRYSWSPPLGLACDTCMITGVNPPNSTTYTLTIEDLKGCTYQESVFVRVRKVRNVFVPDAFTPNGDAHNPLLAVYTGQGVRRINYFRIFNRWGDQVFEQRNIEPGVLSEQSGWDGIYQGKEQPVGVYIYIAEVEFLDGERILYRGDFTLLR